MEELMLYLNYHDEKIRQKHAEQLFLFYWISSAVHNVISTSADRTNKDRIQKPKLYHWATSSYHDDELTSHGD